MVFCHNNRKIAKTGTVAQDKLGFVTFIYEEV